MTHPRGGDRRPARGRPWRLVLASFGVVLLLIAAAGTWVYLHLNGNIQSAPLFNGNTGSAGVETPDAFGDTPINLLVIGSDARADASDCRLGGGCGHASSIAGSSADVEMLVHLAADRSNATVMSIPRDTLAQIPACTDPLTHRSTAGYYGMINSALAYGPGCQVAADHQLAGVPIDHFALVDFSGVVSMADAVGGVSVCVSDNVYDNYSHLKLAKGTHTLTGVAALEFLRSRHAFGDGSDLGRTYAQHLYLASLIRTLKSAGTLTDPGEVYALADAVTRAVTVDPALAGIPELVGLADDVNKVPSSRVTFTTMPTSPDPADANRLVVAPAAQALFAAIRDDQSLTPARPAATAPTSPATSPTGSAASPSPTVSPSPSSTVAAGTLADSHVQTADQSGSCAQVSHQLTVDVDNMIMTPIQAYAYTTAHHVPDSAP